MTSPKTLASPETLRNVLLIHCHDLGRFLGAYGVRSVRTPSLDAFAAGSAVFETAFATAPQCSPARASLFTGTYPQSNGVLGLTHSPFDWDLREPRDHIAHRMRAAGLYTRLIGVQHESKVLSDPQVAERLGFDSVQTGGTGEVVAGRAVQALQEIARAGTPFYFQVGFTEPHRLPSPYDEPGVMGFLGGYIEPDASRGTTVPPYLRDDARAREEIAELQGAVHYMDHQVGRVLAALAACDLAESTVVLFTTDHGLPLPGAKCTLYDPGLEVALLVRAPGRPAWSGARIQGLVSHLDVRPTLVQLLGLEAEDGAAGASLVPLVEWRAPVADHVFGQMTYHTYYDPKRSVRSEGYKLILNFASAPQMMDPTQSWVHRTAPSNVDNGGIRINTPVELYDVADDPGETRNLADNPGAAGIRDALAAVLLEWMRSVDDPLLTAAAMSPHHHAALAALHLPPPGAADGHRLRRPQVVPV